MSRDPDGDRVIACAVIGRAQVVVSGDNDLLHLGRVGAIPIFAAVVQVRNPTRIPRPALPVWG
jgi:predicted nucleic acid-binding protein